VAAEAKPRKGLYQSIKIPVERMGTKREWKTSATATFAAQFAIAPSGLVSSIDWAISSLKAPKPDSAPQKEATNLSRRTEQ